MNYTKLTQCIYSVQYDIRKKIIHAIYIKKKKTDYMTFSSLE